VETHPIPVFGGVQDDLLCSAPPKRFQEDEDAIARRSHPSCPHGLARPPVFKTAAFVRSATLPGQG
jgi:hypothetical protein